MSSYDAFAEAAAVHLETSAYNAHYDRPAVLELLGDVAGKCVLDAGCGAGAYAAELTRRGAAVIAFDASAKLVEHARQRVRGPVDLRVHDLQDPLGWVADGAVDDVIMALVLHHLDDPVPPLRELHRVLRPGGRLIVSTVHPMADWCRLGGSYFTDEFLEETWGNGWDVRFRRAPLTTWCAEFREAGFLIDKLVEPLPADSMKVQFPEVYAKLSDEPAFIVFVLAKLP